MKLVSIVVALSMAIFLSLFFADAVGLVYKAPQYDYASSLPKPSSTNCNQIINNACPSVTSEEYGSCITDAYSSPEYTQCIEDLEQDQTQSSYSYAEKIERYSLFSFITFGVIGLLLIGIGILFVSFETISTGFILGGLITTVFSGLISFFSALGSIFSGSLGSLSGVESSLTLPITKIIFYLICIIILFIFSYKKLDNN